MQSPHKRQLEFPKLGAFGLIFEPQVFENRPGRGPLSEQLDRHKMHEHGQTWLSEGLGHLAEDACPFCGQDIKGNKLVEAYKLFFSESYAALIADIDRISEKPASALGDASLATLGRLIAANDASLEFWKQYIETELAAPDHDTVIAAPLASLREQAEALIAEKKADPLGGVAPDDDFNAAKGTADAALGAIEGYNSAITEFGKEIKAKKEEAGADSATIEHEIAGLTLIQLRHSAKLKPLCDAHNALTSEKVQLDKDKDAAKDALDTHADAMIGQYETTINKLLKGFGAGFALTNSKKTYVGGKPASVYQILINNQAVDIGDSGTPVGEPSFRTTLSAGDKTHWLLRSSWPNSTTTRTRLIGLSFLMIRSTLRIVHVVSAQQNCSRSMAPNASSCSCCHMIRSS